MARTKRTRKTRQAQGNSQHGGRSMTRRHQQSGGFPPLLALIGALGGLGPALGAAGALAGGVGALTGGISTAVKNSKTK